jgi:16S rRNA G966 N2-methylase RsmD
MDPPYNNGLERDVLFALQKSNIIYCDTLVVVEASKQTSFDFLKDTKFRLIRKKEYKSNQHVFLEMGRN